MTLTQVATLTRHTVLITILALFLTITGFVGYRVWYAYYQSSLPPVEEKPDTKFGVLPYPDFPQTSVSSSNFSYLLDTTTGGLPKLGEAGFEKLIKVYFIIKPYATLLSPDKVMTLAEKFGLLSPPQILSETSYQFADEDKNLRVDLDSGNFTYIKEYVKEATLSGELSIDDDNRVIDDDNKLVSDFKKILDNLGILKEELKSGRTKVVPLKSDGAVFIPTDLRTEAEALQISLWPTSIDKKSIFTPDFNESLVTAVVQKSADNLQNYLSLDFTFWQIDQSIFATYPLKSTEEAFENLKSGKGIVILEPGKPQVSITSIYLGYYLSKNYTPYLQPIYVFEGPKFAAYVAAIRDQFQNPAK